jgi:hypothetical protein
MRKLGMLLWLGVVLGGCAAAGRPDDDDGSGPDPNGDDPDMTWSDFPAEPVLEPGVPADAPGLFPPGGATSGGPCIVEPEPGTLFPLGWLRPRFSFVGSGFNLYELRVHADNQVNDLVVYTSEPTWTMPYELWGPLNAHTVDKPFTVTVRAAHHDGSGLDVPPVAGAPSSFTIAPVAASGTIAYWTSDGANGDSAFKGFKVGEETVHTILEPPQAATRCVGCHSSTPDGKFVAFSSSPSGDGGASHVDLRTLDGSAARPEYASASSLTLLGRPGQQQPIFSPGHWRDGDRVALSMFDAWDLGYRVEIIWTDLLATSMEEGVGWGRIARTGDERSAGAAAFSHNGEIIAYTSSDDVGSGVNVNGGGDIYLVPYHQRAGGNATPLAGASDPAYTEHYAAFAPDDALIAFTRFPGGAFTYDNPVSEVFVVPAAGGAPVRLAANDPPACTSKLSPGVTNSWPKWAPEAASSGATRYYWLTFSSRRVESGRPQLYVAPLVIDEVGQIRSFPAIYLWNQPEHENNHTPAWDNFDIVVQ